MWTKRFWMDAVERALKTCAQVVLATGVIGVDLRVVAASAAVAGVVSVLSSVASTAVGDSGSPSLVTPALSPPPRLPIAPVRLPAEVVRDRQAGDVI